MNDLSFFRDSRVLITGGAGMIGSTIARLLVEQGAEVTVVDAMLPHLRRQPLQPERHHGQDGLRQG